MREESRKGRLAYSAFAGENEDLVLDTSQALGNDRDIRVGAFGRRSADLLIGTSCTGVALAGFFGLGTWAVFWFLLVVGLRRYSPHWTGRSYLAPGLRDWAPALQARRGTRCRLAPPRMVPSQ